LIQFEINLLYFRMAPSLRPRRREDLQPNNEELDRDELEGEQVPRVRPVRVNLGPARLRRGEQE
jgi:hypothetical protein